MTPTHPNIAIVYDFDGTLAPGNMQEGRFIPAIGMTNDDFWHMVRHRTAVQQSDPTLAYMQVMLETARENNVTRHPQGYGHLGQQHPLLPRRPRLVQPHQHLRPRPDGTVRHYVISSGNTEIIEASRIAPHFHAIFGSRFAYDDQGNAVWPAEAINFTTKTQYLFRINKNAIRADQRDDVNLYVPQDDRPFPFENIIYLGDGETDIPCFSLVESHGGLAVAVYAPGRRDDAQNYLSQHRVNAIAEADYRPDTHLDRLVKCFIDLAAARHSFTTAIDHTNSTGEPPMPPPVLHRQ